MAQLRLQFVQQLIEDLRCVECGIDHEVMVRVLCRLVEVCLTDIAMKLLVLEFHPIRE